MAELTRNTLIVRGVRVVGDVVRKMGVLTGAAKGQAPSLIPSMRHRSPAFARTGSQSRQGSGGPDGQPATAAERAGRPAGGSGVAALRPAAHGCWSLLQQLG